MLWPAQRQPRCGAIKPPSHQHKAQQPDRLQTMLFCRTDKDSGPDTTVRQYRVLAPQQQPARHHLSSRRDNMQVMGQHRPATSPTMAAQLGHPPTHCVACDAHLCTCPVYLQCSALLPLWPTAGVWAPRTEALSYSQPQVLSHHTVRHTPGIPFPLAQPSINSWSQSRKRHTQWVCCKALLLNLLPGCVPKCH